MGARQRNDETNMDSTDIQIFELLCANGRRSNRDIASRLGLPEKQVANRLRQMLDADDMRILAIADTYAAGFEFMLFVGVEVAQRPAFEVARDLAQLPEVLSVMLTMGSCDIEMVMVAESHASLVTFVKQRLNGIGGIRRFDLSLGLEVHKYETVRGPLLQETWQSMGFPSVGAVDELDKAIIGELWKDARVMNQTIADAVGVSESAVRSRINSLKRRKLLRLTAMRNMRLESGQIFASIGVEVEGRDIDSVAGELSALDDAGFVVSVVGRYDLLVMGMLGSVAELSTLLASRIEQIDGVRKVHTSQVLRFVKYDPRWTAVIGELHDDA